MPRRRAWLAVVMGVLLTAGCTGHPANPEPPVAPSPTPISTPDGAQTRLPAEPTLVVDEPTPAGQAVATSRALFVSAPAVVLAGVADAAATVRAAAVAVDLGVPVLLTSAAPADVAPADPVRAEVERLDPRRLVAVGDEAAAWARTGARAVVAVAPDAADSAALPAVTRPAPLDALLVLASTAPGGAAAVATARAAGARVVDTAGPDPRADPAVVSALAGAPTAHLLAIGSGFGPPERLRTRVETAATGVRLPGGGQVLFPGRRMVALYGHPGDAGLGSLGEQGLPEAVARARAVAGAYAGLDGATVVPAFELIATIASSGPGPDGDYSSESSVDFLRPWVDVAGAAGLYVVLDLQPGRTDFLTQAQRYADLLALPHVGLALDPEWRLKPDQKHLEQIGSVTAGEINRTGRWLADLTRAHRLPQKILMIHQFRLDMVTDRSTLVTDYDELSVVIHADGFGSAGQKLNTWDTLHQDEPPNIFWGWKNFYDEDKPTFTPQQTVAVRPAPVFVSYQ